MRRPFFEMNESLFAEFQRNNCWFEFAMGNELPKINPNLNCLSSELYDDDTLAQRHIFAMIFGGFGYETNLNQARILCRNRLLQTEYREPKDKPLDSPEYEDWFNTFAKYNVLYGTVYAYMGNNIMAARFLLNGLKTRAIGLSMPYCDFIRYVLEKVEELPAASLEIKGHGSSPDNPMGSTSLDGGVLMPEVAEMVISALERDAGGFVLAHVGNLKYGEIRRLGSTGSDNFKNIIDVYEVLFTDSSCKLQKIRLYFNAYFDIGKKQEIRLPNGFHLEPSSLAAKYFKVVE